MNIRFAFLVSASLLLLGSRAFAADMDAEMVRSEQVVESERQMTEVKGDEVKKAPVVKEEKKAEAKPASESLASLIREALQNNNEVKASREGRKAKLAKAYQQRKGYFPKLEGYASYDSQPDVRAISATATSAQLANIQGIPVVRTDNPASGSERTWRRAYGIRAEQMLWDFGETRGKVKQEEFAAEAEAEKAKLKELDAAYNVAEAYWRVAFFQQVVSLRQRSLVSSLKETASFRDRVKANNATQADLRSAEASQAETEQNLLSSQNSLALAKQRLQYFVGREMDGNIAIGDSLVFDKKILERGEFDIENHPDMKRVRYSQQSAEAAAGAAKGGRLPQLFLRGNIEDSTPEPGADAANLAPDGYQYQVSLNLRIPLGYQWVDANGSLKEARARLAQLDSEAAALKGSLKLQVFHARNKLDEAVKGVEVANRRKAAADENLSRVKQMEEAKNAILSDVAKAESEALGAEIGSLRAIYDVMVAIADLDRQMGTIGK